jgi:cytoskeleton protein RodZ
MNTKSQKKEDPKGNDERTPQVGELLRASRLRVGEELREVSDVLCIRFLYLEAIEECRYADLPGDTYAVGFIRSYAEHLGLDGDEVVRRYRTEQMAKGNSSELLFPTPVQDSGVPKGAIVFVGFLIALLVYGGWYVTTTDESILSDIISPVPDHLKHLVTVDDALDNQSADSSEAPATSSTSKDMSSDGSTTTDDAVRVSADAAEQIANATGEVATRTADAARAAAEAAAEAVTAEPSSSTQATPSTEQDVTDAPTVEVTTPAATSAATTNETLDVSTPSAVVIEPAQVNEAPAASASNTSEVVTQPVAEAASDVAPVAPETAATETVTPPASNEVTAEDLNSLVLRQATSTDEQTTATKSNAAASLSGVSIRATSRSWVEVRDPSNGNVLLTGVMSIGSVFDVPDTDGLVLDTGNAGALDITLEGVSVPKIGGVGDVRKSVSLNAERLKAGTATNR